MRNIFKNKIVPVNKRQDGYAVLELLFYLVLFSALSLVLINAMIIMTKSFRENTIYRDLSQSGSIMERMSREIRQAHGINSISTSTLKLNTKDDAGIDKTVEFLLSGSDVQFMENDVLTGNLNAPDIVVTGLTFTQITTVKGQAVKILFTARSSNDALNRTEDFYDTVVLRGDY